MENSGSADSSISGDLGIICESAADPPDPSSSNRDQTSLDHLAIYMNDSLNFQDSQKLTCDFIRDVSISLVKEDTSDEIRNDAGNKCLGKCATFPCSIEMSAAAAGNMEMENGQTSSDSSQSCSPIFATHSRLRSAYSLPSTLKLVPAIKGSREKLGNPPRKVSVTWDPDVYDPVPTAVSHVPTNKNPRHKSDGKKNGRNKQKGGGKSSRGSSKSKDKKQSRKVVGGF